MTHELAVAELKKRQNPPGTIDPVFISSGMADAGNAPNEKPCSLWMGSSEVMLRGLFNFHRITRIAGLARSEQLDVLVAQPYIWRCSLAREGQPCSSTSTTSTGRQLSMVVILPRNTVWTIRYGEAFRWLLSVSLLLNSSCSQSMLISLPQ